MFIKMDSTWTSKPSMLGIDLDALIAMYWVQHSNLLSTFHQLNTKINITVKVISFFHPMPCRLRMVIYIYIEKHDTFSVMVTLVVHAFRCFFHSGRTAIVVRFLTLYDRGQPHLGGFSLVYGLLFQRMYPIVYVYFPFHLPH